MDGDLKKIVIDKGSENCDFTRTVFITSSTPLIKTITSERINDMRRQFKEELDNGNVIFRNPCIERDIYLNKIKGDKENE